MRNEIEVLKRALEEQKLRAQRDALAAEVKRGAGGGRSGEATTRDPTCLLYTSPSPRDLSTSRMPSSA